MRISNQKSLLQLNAHDVRSTMTLFENDGMSRPLYTFLVHTVQDLEEETIIVPKVNKDEFTVFMQDVFPDSKTVSYNLTLRAMEVLVSDNGREYLILGDLDPVH